MDMIEELSELTRRLANLNKDSRVTQNGGDQVAAFEEEFRLLQGRLAQLLKEGNHLASNIDRKVRKNPYVFLAAAAGLGFLLGKVRRL